MFSFIYRSFGRERKKHTNRANNTKCQRKKFAFENRRILQLTDCVTGMRAHANLVSSAAR